MSSDIEDYEHIQLEFVEHLVKLTKAGRVDWFRQDEESGYVYCFCQNDLILFELTDETEGNSNPFVNTHAICGIVRNHRFMWLKDLYGWDDLLGLLRSAEVDIQKYMKYKREMPKIVLKELKKINGNEESAT